MTDTELAYYAGFIDGEGCIYSTNKFVPAVAVSHTYLPILNKLQESFGGSIRDFPNVTHKKRAWKWEIYGDDARALLISLLPYLQEKARQAEIALELFSLRSGRGIKPTDDVVNRKIKLKEELSLCKTMS